MYKAVFFDLDDTLWDFSANAEEAFREAYFKLNYNRFFESFEHFYSIYEKKNEELWVAYRNEQIDKKELNKVRFSYPLEVVDAYNAELVQTFSDTFFSIISNKSTLLPGAIEILEYLVKKYPLYIISNGFEELQYQKMRSAHLEHYFKAVILSDVVGVLKPDKRIFEYALKIAGVSPHEAIMIGDDWEADIVGAMNAGIDQVFIGDLLDNRKNDSTYAITLLSELRGIF